MSRLIESLIGHQSTDVGGSTYVFTKDEHGRFVSLVHNLVHVQCLLSSACYREAPVVVPADEQPAPPVPSSDAPETSEPQNNDAGTAQVSPAAPVAGTVDDTNTPADEPGATSEPEQGGEVSAVGIVQDPDTDTDAAGEQSGEPQGDAAAADDTDADTVAPVERQKRSYKPREKKADKSAQQGE